MKLSYLPTVFCGVLFMFVAFGILATVPAYAQVQSKIDISAGSSENATCVTNSNCFSPNPLHVTPGTTVTWMNSDYTSHTVTSVNSLCNGPHMTIQIATDVKSVDPTVMVRTSLTGMTYAKLAQNQPYAEENVNADVRRLVYEAYVSPSSKSFEVVVSEGVGHNTYSVQKGVQVSGCTVGSVFDSGVIPSTKTYKFTFLNAGNYNYFCTIHPWMMGQVIVEGSSSVEQSNSMEISNVTGNTIPEFPLAIPVMLIGIISVIVFYNVRFR